MNRKTLLGGLAVLGISLVIPNFTIAANKVNITGQYKCEGTNADGNRYRGTVKINQTGNVYYVKWIIGQNQNFNGVGILEGNVLAVSYYGSFSGVVAYKIESSSRLVGKWTTPTDKGRIYTETLTR